MSRGMDSIETSPRSGWTERIMITSVLNPVHEGRRSEPSSAILIMAGSIDSGAEGGGIGVGGAGAFPYVNGAGQPTSKTAGAVGCGVEVPVGGVGDL